MIGFFQKQKIVVFVCLFISFSFLGFCLFFLTDLIQSGKERGTRESWKPDVNHSKSTGLDRNWEEKKYKDCLNHLYIRCSSRHNLSFIKALAMVKVVTMTNVIGQIRKQAPRGK